MSSRYDYNGPPPPIGKRAPGGFAVDESEPIRARPEDADPQLWGWFDRVDEDGSGYIDATELQDALINGDLTSFHINTINLLMNIFGDKRGLINFNDFTDLWKYIKGWRDVFASFDKDKSGTIDDSELQIALTNLKLGFTVTPDLLNILRNKYDLRTSANRRTASGITFDHFVRSCVILQEVDKAFRALDTDKDGWATIDNLQLLRTVLSLP